MENEEEIKDKEIEAQENIDNTQLTTLHWKCRGFEIGTRMKFA